MKNGLIEKDNINGIPVKIDLIPKTNKSSRPQIKMTPEYITIHNTANTNKGAGAATHTEYVDNTSRTVSWHFTVDDHEIYQELPVTEVAWHAGDGNGDGNRKSIGIEICENSDGVYEKAEENAIQLIIFLMEELNISLDKIVPHQHWSGKYCPHIILDYGWDLFINKIKKENSTADQDVSSWAKDAKKWVIQNNISDGTRAKDQVTREEVWTMLYRLSKQQK